MTFPFYIFGMHPHLLFEATAYLLGFLIHVWMQKRMPRQHLEPEQRLWLLAGLVAGALIGARLVAFFDTDESPASPLAWVLGGKSIVGALTGGWIGVEIAKVCNKVKSSTGDSWVIALLASIALGRVGCFLTGISDHTYGVLTNLIWGVDFGDGIRRHPTQLYETFFCLGMIPLFGLFMALTRRRPGALFRLFMIVYMLFRFAIEFIKPTPKIAGGISILQIVCLVTAAYAFYELLRRPKRLVEVAGTETANL